MMLPNVVGDDTVVGGGPLSMISSAACAATGISMAANALDDNKAARQLTRDPRCSSEPANLRSRIAPLPAARARKDRPPKPRQAGLRPQLSFVLVGDIGRCNL